MVAFFKSLKMKKIFIFLVLFSVSHQVFCQKFLGEYLLSNNKDKEQTTLYNFFNNGTFKFVSYGNYAISQYGVGHFSVEKDSLFFNFNLPEQIQETYHKYTFTKSNEDFIELKINFITHTQEKVQNIDVGSINDNIGLSLNNVDKAVMKLKKNNEMKKIFISSEYGFYSFEILGKYNYEINVFLKEDFKYDFATPIQKTILKYKILKHRKDFFQIQNAEGEVFDYQKVGNEIYNPFGY